MGLLLNKMNICSENMSNEIYSKPEYFNTDFVTDMESFMAEENAKYNTILTENLYADFVGNKSNDLSIITEGFTDMISNVVKWFKHWLKVFKKKVMQFLRYLCKFFSKYEANADRYLQSQGFFEPFKIKGYSYKITDVDLPIQLLEEYMNDVRNRAEEIKKYEINNIRQGLYYQLSNVSGKHILDCYRGKMLNMMPLTYSQFKKCIKDKIQNGTDKIEITIGRPQALVICKQYKYAKKVIDSMVNAKKKLQDITNVLIEFIDCEAITDKDNPKVNIQITDMSDVVDVPSALSKFYSQVNLTIRQLHSVFALYYDVKTEVLRDAIAFYAKIINKVYFMTKLKIPAKNISISPDIK